VLETGVWTASELISFDFDDGIQERLRTPSTFATKQTTIPTALKRRETR
jgi:hypothetical protein